MAHSVPVLYPLTYIWPGGSSMKPPGPHYHESSVSHLWQYTLQHAKDISTDSQLSLLDITTVNAMLSLLDELEYQCQL